MLTLQSDLLHQHQWHDDQKWVLGQLAALPHIVLPFALSSYHMFINSPSPALTRKCDRLTPVSRVSLVHFEKRPVKCQHRKNGNHLHSLPQSNIIHEKHRLRCCHLLQCPHSPDQLVPLKWGPFGCHCARLQLSQIAGNVLLDSLNLEERDGVLFQP